MDLVIGFAAVVGVIIFCAMLDKDQYELQWAPYLNCGGGTVYIFFGVGGYFSWRNTAAEDFDDDRCMYGKEIAVKVSKPFLEKNSLRGLAKESEVINL